jgi:hypothetical protein
VVTGDRGNLTRRIIATVNRHRSGAPHGSNLRLPGQDRRAYFGATVPFRDRAVGGPAEALADRYFLMGPTWVRPTTVNPAATSLAKAIRAVRRLTICAAIKAFHNDALSCPEVHAQFDRVVDALTAKWAILRGRPGRAHARR